MSSNTIFAYRGDTAALESIIREGVVTDYLAIRRKLLKAAEPRRKPKKAMPPDVDELINPTNPQHDHVLREIGDPSSFLD